jgi:hypothetical protein
MGIIISRENFSRSDETVVYHEDGTVQRVESYESVYITEETPFDEVYVDVEFQLHKARESEQLVSGWASVSVNANGSVPLDWQDDIIAPETLEKAAINFMMDYRESGVMHEGDSVGTVVESIVFTKEKQEAIGIPEGTVPIGWFITVKVHDTSVFAKVKDGTYKMFSIQGKCRRVKQ